MAKAAVLCCLVAPGLASAACTVPGPGTDEAALQEVLAQLPACQRDANYLASIGQLLNQRGRYLEAADHLERALMLAPELKGAQIDYAISLAGSGDGAAAKSLLTQLLADPSLPANLRPLLERQLAVWAAPAGWQTRLLVNVRSGYDSNLLGSPNLSSLTLTFPGQSVELPLDDTYRARGGAYLRTDVQMEFRRETAGGGHVESYVGLRNRRSPTVAEANSLNADAAIEYGSYRRGSAGQGVYVGASASDLDARSGLRYRAYGVSGGWSTERWVAGCETRSGLEVQERRYRNNDLLSGRYRGLAASISCDRAAASQWLASVRAGTDQARNSDRAGGDQTQIAMRFVGVLAGVGPGKAPKGQLWADLELSYARDKLGYSPLLETGRLRTVQRAGLRLEYQYPLAPNIQAAAGAESTRQRSSLALFGSGSWGPYLAVRTVW